MRKRENAPKGKYKQKRSLLPFTVILAATNGEEVAIQRLLQHYEGYITTLASKELFDQYGNLYTFIDYELKTELQNKLIMGILKFRITQ